MTMKIVSWNVNGIRAILKKDFIKDFKNLNADIFCLQETKANDDQVLLELDGYKQYWNNAEKKGYSGTVIFSRIAPISITKGIGKEYHDKEGRVLTLEFEKFYLVNAYIPNSGRKLVRLDYRHEWDREFSSYLSFLDKKKPVVLCGDLNVAHTDIDLANPKSNYNKTSGFTQVEIDGFEKMLNKGFIDVYRYFYPNKKDVYTYWSYMFSARSKNIGWRIDYFLVSKRFISQVKSIKIESEIMGSDHCPVVLKLK